MALHKEDKAKVLKQFQKSELDTGSSEVQVALLTVRIKTLTEHFKKNKKDHHGRRGLVRMVNRRRKLLDYLKKNEPATYTKMLAELGLRK